MKFADFVCIKAIIPELQARDRDGVIAELVLALDKASRLGKGNCEEVINAVMKRENEASTGMGKGVAVPHVKHKAVKDVVAAIGQSSVGIDFSALDKRPVYSVLARDRIQAELGLTIPSWQDGLSRYFDQRVKERK